jgi:hypothetical protein
MKQDHLSKQERKKQKQFRQQRKVARGRQYEAINYWNNTIKRK